MASRYEEVKLETSDGIARISLNRPEALNPWGTTMRAELLDAVTRVAEDAEVRCVIVTGEGRGFCSGADLKGGALIGDDGKPDVKTPLDTQYHPTMIAIREMPKPVIASVNGACVGVGVGLAAASDVVIAAESAYFLLAFAKIGLTQDGGSTAFLPPRIGLGRMTEMGLLADKVDAETAREWGLVNRVVADDELRSATDELAARLARGSTGSFAATKRLVNAAVFPDYRAQLDREAVEQQKRATSADFVEGVTAFIEKREPVFPGD